MTGGVVTPHSETAMDAFEKSCYLDMDFTISDQETVQKAVEKLTAFGVGCLLTTDANGKLSGILSERDIIHKVALLDRPREEVKVKEIYSPNPVTVYPDECIDDCMHLMLKKDFRHLPLVARKGDDNVVVGMISIKDCVKTVMDHQEETIQVLRNFAMGKSGTFVCD
eukprot:CAMPEP_0119003696 /NCGR_PEP_ID=MMETSP1176-20130426/717_1 /TAXON_ID=265551 /ORGANISM="Synedropsis recta cf, Strain CCMP1620" /LENGTH=166 /DNA_ID=CAMNT_0006955319 /DNA_START=193 /DNA_END=693 /DNA_ORIENTATION=-